jgi:hypothetical protein
VKCAHFTCHACDVVTLPAEVVRQVEEALDLADCCYGNGFGLAGDRIHHGDCRIFSALAALRRHTKTGGGNG